MPTWLLVPGAVLVLAGVFWRALSALSKRVNDHAERLARLEGAQDARRAAKRDDCDD